KFGLYHGERLVHRWQSPDAQARTADQIAAEVAPRLKQVPPAHGGIEAIVIACVVPDLVEPLRQFCRQVYRSDPHFAGETLIPNLPNRYDPPSAVGADRLVNALAALRHYGAPAII